MGLLDNKDDLRELVDSLNLFAWLPVHYLFWPPVWGRPFPMCSLMAYLFSL